MATGTQATTYSDREFLFRLQTLIIHGGTEVLRNIFDQRLHNQPLYVLLANEKGKINRLRAQKTIKSAQYDLLFPPQGGQHPTSADLDITLLICLLRNLSCFGLKQNNSWNVPPQPTDTSLVADIYRLRCYRNEVLLRLNSAMTNPIASFNQTIDSYENSPLDTIAEIEINEKIKQWNKMDRDLDEQMHLLKVDIDDMKKTDEHIKQNMRHIQQDATETMQDIKDTKKEVNDLKKALSNPRRRHETKKRVFGTLWGHFAFKGKLKAFQDDLISFYRKKHSNIQLSPLLEDDAPLLKFYVIPDISSMKINRDWEGIKEERKKLENLRDVFYKTSTFCTDIYLIADAGFGKTALSKRLALTWCQAKDPRTNDRSYFQDSEVEVMKGFKFVFLILLRDSSNECNIDDLIMKQLIQNMSNTYTLEDVQNILSKKKCLVILDGLDEWTHSTSDCKQDCNIPQRRVRKRVAVLTTTRPWKFSMCSLKASEIDQKLELTGLNEKSANRLKYLILSHLFTTEDINKINQAVVKFDIAVSKKLDRNLEKIPLILVYNLFLWHYQINIEKSNESLCRLYSRFSELLLSRTVLKYDNVESIVQHTQGKIPSCFMGLNYCKQFYTLLTALGQLAFHTLYKEDEKENGLVFDISVAKKHLNEVQMHFSLSTGIITQNSVQGKLFKENPKVSFAHKTVQEYFAALYMNSSIDISSVSNRVLSKCKHVHDILEMSKNILFISGFNMELASSISRELMKIVNEDETTKKYRNTHQEMLSQSPLKDLQDMYISCFNEITCENEASLCLQDMFIGRNCQQEQYRNHLKQMTTKNKENIRSLYINMSDMENTPYSTAKKVIDYFVLCDLENIEKIHYTGKYSDDILPLLNTSVKCLYLSCIDPWSPLLFEKVNILQKLEAIKIGGFKMSHSELNLLLKYISKRNCMREIELLLLECTDHKDDSCTGLSVDLSQHFSLRGLTLYWLPLTQVVINMSSLENCYLQHLYNPGLRLKFLNCEDCKLDTFVCRILQSYAAIDTVLDTLSLLRHVREVKLWRINLGTRTLTFSPHLNIEYLGLTTVTMEAFSISELVELVQKLPQSVRVVIFDCIVTPRKKFQSVKEKIKTSRTKFRILEDIKDRKERFVFETIKDGD